MKIESNRIKRFKLGDVTDKVWAGDLIIYCEFISYLNDGSMIFYDTTSKCFRRAYLARNGAELILDGWQCSQNLSGLINDEKD